MSKSRIKKYHHSNNYCELDGTKCVHCRNCDHTHSTSNFLLNCIIALLIIFVSVILFCQIIPMGIEKHNDLIKEQSNNPITLEDEVADYNMNMPNNERRFREWSGIGEESISDNYNSMG